LCIRNPNKKIVAGGSPHPNKGLDMEVLRWPGQSSTMIYGM
jgi:hypothetical protein